MLVAIWDTHVNGMGWVFVAATNTPSHAVYMGGSHSQYCIDTGGKILRSQLTNQKATKLKVRPTYTLCPLLSWASGGGATKNLQIAQRH